MRDPNSISGVALMILSLLGLLISRNIDIVDVIGMREDFYPKFLLFMLFSCGLYLAYDGLKKSVKDALPNFEFRKLLPAILAMSCYIFLLEYLGYIVATAVFLIVSMYVFGEHRVKLLISVPIITTIVIYILFTEIFMIILP